VYTRTSDRYRRRYRIGRELLVIWYLAANKKDASIEDRIVSVLILRNLLIERKKLSHVRFETPYDVRR
jgi:hypothetical protein